MNPFPPLTVPTEAIPVAAFADPIMLAAMIALVVVFAMLLWSARSALQRRERRVCPERLRPAKLRVAVGPAGNAIDVLRCSLVGPGPVTCSKACIAASPAGE
jgi:hypothetical protein